MTDLLVATANKGKMCEISAVLAAGLKNIRLLTPGNLGITDVPEETGESFLENSTLKSVFYSSRIEGILTIADDSGLCVDTLNGAPGVRSARYAGPDADDNRNIARLLAELEGIEKRDAGFVSVITLSLNGSVVMSFRGEARGEIRRSRRGQNGFGYDPVFWYPPLEKTFAELTGEEKNRVSHRAEALNKLRDFLTGNPHLMKNGRA